MKDFSELKLHKAALESVNPASVKHARTHLLSLCPCHFLMHIRIHSNSSNKLHLTVHSQTDFLFNDCLKKEERPREEKKVGRERGKEDEGKNGRDKKLVDTKSFIPR